MIALWNDQVIAEADKDDLIYIEGNWYFPPESIKREFFQPSTNTSQCFWKGEANYYNVVVDGQSNPDAAWYYHKPMESAFEKTKKDFTDYVAFWRGVEVTDQVHDKDLSTSVSVG